MLPGDIFQFVLLATAGALAGALVVCLPWRRFDLRRAAMRDRGRELAPYAGLLAAALLVNKWTLETVTGLSWLIHWDITPGIYALEGATVAWVQALVPEAAVAYFSFVYVVGYVFLLVFPMVAYFLLDMRRPLKVLLVAYALNYAVGLACYGLTIAYGPRNYLAGQVTQPMYTTYPEVMFLTSSVNANTNVFPSLHASLSVTVILLAVRFRHGLSRWVPVATVVGTSILVSTVYLGIHWVTDVVAGVLLAGVAVFTAETFVDRFEADDERTLSPPSFPFR